MRPSDDRGSVDPVWSELAIDEDGELHVHRRAGRRPPIVLLHGFTQTGRSWDPVVTHLDPDAEIYLPDAPGHGASSGCRIGIADYADALATHLPPAVYVGYSMGGRTALHIAVHHPDAALALVLVGASPGLDDASERAERRRRDDELAERLETMDLDAFLSEWLSQPLFASLPTDRQNLDDRRRNTSSGLAHSLRSAGTGVQDSLWSRLGDIDCPTTLVTGRDDLKFSTIADRMAELFGGQVRRVDVPGRGHAVHLEDPITMATIVESSRTAS